MNDLSATQLFESATQLANSLARKYGTPQTFDDLRQVAQLALWRAAEAIEASRGVQFSTYAYRWILNAVSNAARLEARSRRAFTQGSAEFTDTSVSEPFANASHGEDLDRLRSALATVDSDTRQLALDWAGGSRQQEIAGRLGVTRQAVNKRLQGVVIKLRCQMA